jgi:phospholipase C
VPARLLVLGLCAALAACSVRGAAPVFAGAAPAPRQAAGIERHATTPITHVVVVMQENRSFNNLFVGYPNATTATSGTNSSGQTITLAPVSLTANYDIDHTSSSFFAACDGNPIGQNCKMDGFDKENACCEVTQPNPQYAYVPRSQVAPYWALAKRYVLADKMFTSNIDASFVSHQYIIAGYASHAVDLPLGTWGCGGAPGNSVKTLNADRTYGSPIAPCFSNPTIADELDAAHLPWRYYETSSSGGVWDGYMAISQIRNGHDWLADNISPSTQFTKDVAAGKLAAVTWITPSLLTSDHGGSRSKKGPAWVASVVNAVGRSQFWNSTAIFIMWDEWGGWYDPVPPPYVDYDGLGFRVPLLVVSAYAKKNYVSHVQFEHGSILKFIEDSFGLARLADSDTRATSPAADCFAFSKPPRPFKAIPADLPGSALVDQYPQLPDNQ